MITRRQVLQASGTFAGYALAVDKAFAQVIKTDTSGLTAGDVEVKIGDYTMPAYEARPASATNAPIVLVISEVWGVHEYIRDSTRRFAKEGFYAIAPELFKREGGVGQLTDIQAILKIVFNQPREQTLGDLRRPWTSPRGGRASPPTVSVSPAGAGAAGWRSRSRPPTHG